MVRTVSKKKKANLPVKKVGRKVSSVSPKKRSRPFPVVAIGASAGGIEAMTALLKNLPSDTGMAYVYIQHLAPTHKSLLSVILGKITGMTVLEAKEKMHIERNHLYVIPPNKDMHIIDGVL